MPSALIWPWAASAIHGFYWDTPFTPIPGFWVLVYTTTVVVIGIVCCCVLTIVVDDAIDLLWYLLFF